MSGRAAAVPLAVFGVLLAAAGALPLAAPFDPDAMPDTAALRVLPPLSTAFRVARRDRPDVWATAVTTRGDVLILERAPRPLEVKLSDLSAPVESRTFLLGTDQLGRDILSRCLSGSRLSILVAGAAVAVAALVGTAVGTLAGAFGPRLDAGLMRVTDVVLSFPRVFLVLLLASLFSRSVTLVVLALGLTGWMGIARQVRAETLSLRAREFALAATALGARPARLALRHLLPNALTPVLTEIGLRFAGALLAESSLSYLGIGVPPPQATWGTIVADGRDSLATAWWISVVPGLFLVATALAVGAAADSLRRALIPGARR